MNNNNKRPMNGDEGSNKRPKLKSSSDNKDLANQGRIAGWNDMVPDDGNSGFSDDEEFPLAKPLAKPLKSSSNTTIPEPKQSTEVSTGSATGDSASSDDEEIPLGQEYEEHMTDLEELKNDIEYQKGNIIFYIVKFF